MENPRGVVLFLNKTIGQSPPEHKKIKLTRSRLQRRAIKKIAQESGEPRHSTQRKKKKTREKEKNKPKQKLTKKTKKLSLNGVKPGDDTRVMMLLKSD